MIFTLPCQKMIRWESDREVKLFSEPNPVDPDAGNFGTLGFIIMLDTGLETKHAIRTAGHVLGDTGNTLSINIDGNLETLTTINQFERIGGRPMARSRWRIDRRALDDICLLDIPHNVADVPLHCILGDVNCHAIVGLSPSARDCQNAKGVLQVKIWSGLWNGYTLMVPSLCVQAWC